MSETMRPGADQSKWQAPKPAPGERARAARERHAARANAKNPDVGATLRVNEATSRMWAENAVKGREDKAAEEMRRQEVGERIRVAENS